MSRLKIIFAGSPDFALTQLKALYDGPHDVVAVYTQPDRPSGRGRKLTPCPVKAFAQENDIPVETPTTLKDAKVQQKLLSYQCDLMIVSAYGLILPKPILDAPEYGCWCIHYSLLPRWRGPSPAQFAILDGDKETGITLMQMNEGIDEGNIIAKSTCPITATDTSGSLYQKMGQLGVALLNESIDALLNDTLPNSILQDSHLATYAPKIAKKDAVIDWQDSAPQIERKIRAFQPWPVAYTFLDEQPIKIYEASVLSHSQLQQTIPGEILAQAKEGIEVATKDGVLLITKLQLPGKKAMPVSEILKAHQNFFACGKQFANT